MERGPTFVAFGLLLECAFRMNPKVGDDFLGPTILYGVSADTMIICFRSNRELPSSVTYTLQESPSLEIDSWEPVTSQANITDLDETVATVNFMINAESTEFRFFRVHVTSTP
jgi:hypothetical protein